MLHDASVRGMVPLVGSEREKLKIGGWMLSRGFGFGSLLGMIGTSGFGVTSTSVLRRFPAWFTGRLPGVEGTIAGLGVLIGGTGRLANGLNPTEFGFLVVSAECASFPIGVWILGLLPTPVAFGKGLLSFFL